MAEVVSMTVRGHQRGPCVVVAVQRNDELDLEVLLDLVGCEHAPGSAEERIVGHLRDSREPEHLEHLEPALHPEVAVSLRPFRRAKEDELPLPERLCASRVCRGLASEAPALDVQALSVGGQGAGEEFVSGMAGSRDHHEVGR